MTKIKHLNMKIAIKKLPYKLYFTVAKLISSPRVREAKKNTS